MVIIIALKHTALGFCLCQQEFTHAGCDCAQEAQVETNCGCCPDEPGDSAPAPCDDCVVKVSIDPGEFLWSTSQFEPNDEIGTPLTLPVGRKDFHAGLVPALLPQAPSRGSPGGPALFLRTGVLRL